MTEFTPEQSERLVIALETIAEAAAKFQGLLTAIAAITLIYVVVCILASIAK